MRGRLLKPAASTVAKSRSTPIVCLRTNAQLRRRRAAVRAGISYADSNQLIVA